MELYPEAVRLLQAHQAQITLWLQSEYTKNCLNLIEAIADNTSTLTDEQYEDVTLAYDHVIQLLFSSAYDPDGDSAYASSEFWTHGIGKKLMAVRCWLHDDELITLREASLLLRGSAEDRDLISINGYIKRGKLQVFIDNDSPNKQHSRRVLRSEVGALKNGN